MMTQLIRCGTIQCLVNSGFTAKISLGIIMLVFKSIVTTLNCHLIIIHIWLNMKNMTTYEWIVRKRVSNKVEHHEHPNNEEEVPDSNGIMSNRHSNANSLNLYRSKIVHKRRK